MTRPSLYDLYCQDCQQKSWEINPAMQDLCDQMDRVYDAFHQSSGHWLRRFFTSSSKPSQGIYLSGPVGRGKSYLMNLFYAHQSQTNKARWHFTEFMQLVHHQLAYFSHEQDKKKHQKGKGQPIQRVAHHMAHMYKLICLDEFQVTEIAEAMILYRLFEHFINEGIFFIVTSNCAPEDLYRGGLHYDRFQPFVQLIQSSWHHLLFDHEGEDYRRLASQMVTTKTDENKRLEKIFEQYVQQEGLAIARFVIHEREIIFERATPLSLWASFSDLCEQPFGPAEYQAIAQKFRTVFVSDIPLLGADNRDAARRFITLVDCLYDENVRLFFDEGIDPDHLYREEGAQALPFARTASRLVQMRRESGEN